MIALAIAASAVLLAVCHGIWGGFVAVKDEQPFWVGFLIYGGTFLAVGLVVLGFYGVALLWVTALGGAA